MPRESLYIRVDSKVKEHLSTLAKETGLPLNQVAEMVIARGLQKPDESATERLNKLIEERFK